MTGRVDHAAPKPLNSKQRYRIRKRAEQQEKFKALQATGAKCGNCKEFREKVPSPGMDGHWCDRHSDFHGYQMVKTDDLCLDHKPAPSG